MSICLTIVPTQYLYQPISDSAYRILAAIAQHTNCNTHQAWPSIRRLATLLHRTGRSVQRALRELEAAGLIQTLARPHNRPDGGQSSNLYTVPWPPDETSALTQPDLDVTRAGEKSVTRQSEKGVAHHPREKSVTQNKVAKLDRLDKLDKVRSNPKLGTELDEQDQEKNKQKNPPLISPPPRAPKPRASVTGSPIFDQAMAAYPKRPNVSRADAWTQWRRRAKEGIPEDTMLAGTRAYAAYIAREGKAPDYTKLPATFFGPGRHFLNDYAPVEPLVDPGAPDLAPYQAVWAQERGGFLDAAKLAAIIRPLEARHGVARTLKHFGMYAAVGMSGEDFAKYGPRLELFSATFADQDPDAPAFSWMPPRPGWHRA